jgi:hypothetical protein
LSPDKVRRAAQRAAEQLQKETGAPFTIAIALVPDGAVPPALVMGAWVPSVEMAAEILRCALESLDQGTATVIDKRKV